MNKNAFFYISVLIGIALVFGACHRVKPQSPSNRRQAKDSIDIAVLELNRQLAISADRQLTEMQKANPQDYALHEFGFWFRKRVATNADYYKTHDKVNVHVTVFTLDSVQVADLQEEVVVGGQNELRCLNLVLPMMGAGETIEVLAPWYQAYGPQGNDFAEPYENLRLIIQTDPQPEELTDPAAAAPVNCGSDEQASDNQ